MEQALRVIYFHQHFITPKGAGGTRSYEMAKALVSKGHHVTMVCGSYSGGNTGLESNFLKGRREGAVEGIDVIEFDLSYSNSDGFIKRSYTFIKFAVKSIGLALTKKYDVLFATTTPLTAGLPGIFARWLRGKEFVFEVRDLWPELPKAMGVIKNPMILFSMSILEWISYKSANRCIALSPGIFDGIHKKGVSKEKIALIPNGCDLSLFENKLYLWRPKGVSEDDFLAVFAGTHGTANGLDSVLAAAKELKSVGKSKIKIVLIGSGKLKPQLILKAKAQKLDNIIFSDPVSKEKLSGLFASADIGLQVLANVPAFYYGTSPNKFFDYISAGLPVINNYPGWLATMIEENNCGYVVLPEDPKAFADALIRASKGTEELKLMALNARKLAEKDFDRKQLSDQWVSWVTGEKHD